MEECFGEPLHLLGWSTGATDRIVVWRASAPFVCGLRSSLLPGGLRTEDDLCLRCAEPLLHPLCLFLGLVEETALILRIFRCRISDGLQVCFGQPMLLEEEQHMNMPVVCVIGVDG